jgi:hypothetical protein
MRIGSSLQSQGRRPIRASASQVAVVPSTEPPQRKEICCRNMLVGVRANHLATTGQIKFDSFRSDGQLISTRELSPRSLTAGLPRACIKLECSSWKSSEQLAQAVDSPIRASIQHTLSRSSPSPTADGALPLLTASPARYASPLPPFRVRRRRPAGLDECGLDHVCPHQSARRTWCCAASAGTTRGGRSRC